MLEHIISGGQTGVDRAALDVALEHNFQCSGWCPKGRKAEDGPLPARYPVKETKSSDYRVRTELNVKETDGTLVLTWGKPTGGTAFTIKLAHKHKKPCLVLGLEKNDPEIVMTIKNWIEKNNVRVLNVAGPRESKTPGIYKTAKDILIGLLDSTYACSH